MNLPNPVPGVDPGPDYANNLQASLNVVDQHNHTSGSGVQIPVAGLNINTALPLNNNPITAISVATFTQQSSSAVLNSIFVGTDGNLYFNDGNGDASIQITKTGGVNATVGTLGTPPNSASFVSNVLVVNAAALTPANIQGASLLMGNNTSGTKYLTLAPPAAMPSNYNLILPAIPGSLSFVTLDTSGNFGTASSVSPVQIAANSIQGSQIAIGTVTGGISGSGNLAQQTVTQSNLQLRGSGAQSVLPGNIAVSSAITFSTTSFDTWTNATGAYVTIQTTGRPVFVGLISGGTAYTNTAYLFGENVGPNADGYDAVFQFARTGTSSASIGQVSLRGDSSATGESLFVPVSCLHHVDIVPAGTYTYQLQMTNDAASSIAGCQNAIVVAYEI